MGCFARWHGFEDGIVAPSLFPLYDPLPLLFTFTAFSCIATLYSLQDHVLLSAVAWAQTLLCSPGSAGHSGP